jgi:hypothetical protein
MEVRASNGSLIDIFERMENFFKGLEIYIEVPRSLEMMDFYVKIMVGLLSIIEIATKEINLSRPG